MKVECMSEMSETADFKLQNEGSICVLYPQTEEADLWWAENVAEGLNWCGGWVVETSQIENIVWGIEEDAGLTIE